MSRDVIIRVSNQSLLCHLNFFICHPERSRRVHFFIFQNISEVKDLNIRIVAEIRNNFFDSLNNLLSYSQMLKW